MTLGILDLISLGQGGVAGISEQVYEPITYPLNHPTLPGFRNVRFKQQRAQKLSESPTTLASQVEASTGERWFVEVTLPLMKRSTAAEWQGWFNMLDGKLGTFMLGDSLGKIPRGNPAGVPVVKNSDQTGKTLVVSGAVAETPEWLLAGDYFQVGQRLYQVSRRADSDVNGDVILDFWPRLREIYAVGTPLITANCQGLFRLTEVSSEVWEANESQLYTISFSAEEAL